MDEEGLVDLKFFGTVFIRPFACVNGAEEKLSDGV